jgi:hypothetical protein
VAVVATFFLCETALIIKWLFYLNLIKQFLFYTHSTSLINSSSNFLLETASSTARLLLNNCIHYYNLKHVGSN